MELSESILSEAAGRIGDDIIKSSKFAELLFAMQEFRGMNNLAFTACVLSVYRLRETRVHLLRDHLLVDWLFTDKEARDLGLPPLQEFIGGGKQWANSSLSGTTWRVIPCRKATKSRPGGIVPARVLGTAVRQAGLSDWKVFVARVREELTPAVQNIRDH